MAWQLFHEFLAWMGLVYNALVLPNLSIGRLSLLSHKGMGSDSLCHADYATYKF